MTRIRSLTQFTTKQKKWDAVDHVLLHELGHARGLMALYNGDPDWDHNHHEGLNSSSCVMLHLFEPIKPFTFCQYHRKV